ncbi:MAG: hypothetical protein AAGJ46_05990 [Planctomycetota bacterium]
MGVAKNRAGGWLGCYSRFVSAATSLSVAGFLLCLAILPLSYLMDLPSPDGSGGIETGSAIRVGSLRIAASDGRLWLFNNDLPYSGSTISLEGSWDGVPVAERRDWGFDGGRFGIEQVSYIDADGRCAGSARFGDFPGIYYRHFSWRTISSPWATLSISVGYAAACLSVLPLVWLTRRLLVHLKYTTRSLLMVMTIAALVLAGTVSTGGLKS